MHLGPTGRTYSWSASVLRRPGRVALLVRVWRRCSVDVRVARATVVARRLFMAAIAARCERWGFARSPQVRLTVVLLRAKGVTGAVLEVSALFDGVEQTPLLQLDVVFRRMSAELGVTRQARVVRSASNGNGPVAAASRIHAVRRSMSAPSSLSVCEVRA